MSQVSTKLLFGISVCWIIVGGPWEHLCPQVKAEQVQLPVAHPENLPHTLAAERIPIGGPGHYKPCIARLPSGELWIVAFHGNQVAGNKLSEQMVLFRSTDEGRNWSNAEPLPLIGREPYFSILPDGTIFITAQILAQEIRNTEDHTHSCLHRSLDGGKTWKTTMITGNDLVSKEKASIIFCSRNVLQLKDGSLIFGAGGPHDNEYLWRSNDRGASWDRSHKCEYLGVDPELLKRDPVPVLAEAIYRQAPNGELLAICRVNNKYHPSIPNTVIPAGKSDQFERMVLYRSSNGGTTWNFSELGSHYGEMYPSVLKLLRGQLLFTFTLRSAVSPNEPPLGVRAVIGKEMPAGFEFNFRRDRIVVSNKTPVGKPSGGGFGPTVQLDDGTLITAYSYRAAEQDGRFTRLEVIRWHLPKP